MTKIARLQKAIKDQHGCDSEHLLTRPVRETFQGKVIWEGDVEIFRVENSETPIAYAWSYKTDKGRTRYVAVLAIPPIHTAVDAVRAHLKNPQAITVQSRKKITRTQKAVDRSESDVDTQTADMIQPYLGRRRKVPTNFHRVPIWIFNRPTSVRLATRSQT